MGLGGGRGGGRGKEKKGYLTPAVFNTSSLTSFRSK